MQPWQSWVIIGEFILVIGLFVYLYVVIDRKDHARKVQLRHLTQVTIDGLQEVRYDKNSMAVIAGGLHVKFNVGDLFEWSDGTLVKLEGFNGDRLILREVITEALHEVALEDLYITASKSRARGKHGL